MRAVRFRAPLLRDAAIVLCLKYWWRSRRRSNSWCVMMKLRSVSALVVLGSIAACATATNSGPVADSSAGASNGSSGSPSSSGGAPAGGSAQAGAATAGAPSAGAPSSTAGAATGGSSTGGAATAGSSTGGAATGGAATAGASTGGATAHAGATGVAGAAVGGSAGTSSSAGGSPTDGDGGILAGACANPIDASMGKTPNFGTTGAVCYRTTETFNSLGCSNFDGRTVKVNGVVVACGTAKATFAAPIGGYTYFDVSAGTYAYASIFWYSS